MKPGDTVCVLAPASSTTDDRIQAGLSLLEGLGFRYEHLAPVSGSRFYLAGSDRERARLLASALDDERYAAVWCLRGGFGCVRTLEALGLERLRAASRPLIGFSDVTTLLLNMPEFGVHGPVVTQLPNLDRYSVDRTLELLAGELDRVRLRGASKVLRAGRAEGPLAGGNLSILCSLIGTPYLPDLSGALLFVEDTHEPPYRLDRLLTQLRLHGILSRIAGLLIGHFTGIGEHQQAAVDDLLREVSTHVNGPVLRGLPIGHGAENVALPMWRPARLDSENPWIELL